VKSTIINIASRTERMNPGGTRVTKLVTEDGRDDHAAGAPASPQREIKRWRDHRVRPGGVDG
jgi:hypothetical protein